MLSETHLPHGDMLIRDIIARMRHDGCGGRAGKGRWSCSPASECPLDRGDAYRTESRRGSRNSCRCRKSAVYGRPRAECAAPLHGNITWRDRVLASPVAPRSAYF